MGVISDAIDALEDWCKDLFKDGIKSQFDGISDLLTDTFAQTTGSGGSGGLVNDFVTQHPSQFTGGGTGGTTIWSTIETLCNNVVVPIGGFILTVILLNELIQMVLRGNNFKDFDDSIFIKWIIKALTTMFISAVEAVRTAVTTTANRMQAKATVLGLTNSSRLPTPRNLDSTLTVTATVI